MMRRVHVVQRANVKTRRSEIENGIVKAKIEWEIMMPRDPMNRRLAVIRCGCGLKHWGRRESTMVGKQKDVNKLCNKCFIDKYGKARPENVSKFIYRKLNTNELEALNRYYEATGVKIIT